METSSAGNTNHRRRGERPIPTTRGMAGAYVHASRTGRIEKDDVLIRTKLAPRERICVSPLQVVVEGMQVRPVSDDAGARS